MRREALRMERVTYVEHGITLLDNFNFQIYEGEVMGLVPLDSTGTDTIIRLMQENLPLLYGYVYIQEEQVNTYSGRAHTENNVLVISGGDNLVKYLSAAENIFILRRGYKGIIVKNSIIQSQLRLLLDELGLDIRIDRPMQQMTLFERYVLEITKAVVSRTDLIVLQDPSSVLNPRDLPQLYRVVRHYAQQGNTFVYISVHREEMVQVCDRISMMESGRIIKAVEREGLTEELMSHYAFPHFQIVKNARAEYSEQAERIFSFRNVCYSGIRDLSFSVKKGECLVIHDYENLISNDLIDLLSFAKPEKGQLLFRGKRFRRKHLRQTAVILENPLDTMLFDCMPYEDNLCLTMDHRIGGMWSRGRVRRYIAKEIMGEQLPDMRTQVRYLSVRQKYQLIYTRVLLQHPDVVFCFHPYLNIDVELQDYIQALLRMFLERGISVVIVAVNFRDALTLADRLLLVKNGANTGVLNREEFQHMQKSN